MKRMLVWLFYLIGALSVAYLLAYVYLALTAPRITPGDPIEIYRDPDAPNYSMNAPLPRVGRQAVADKVR